LCWASAVGAPDYCTVQNYIFTLCSLEYYLCWASAVGAPDYCTVQNYTLNTAHHCT